MQGVAGKSAAKEADLTGAVQQSCASITQREWELIALSEAKEQLCVLGNCH